MAKRESNATSHLKLPPEVVEFMQETQVCLNCGKELQYLDDKSSRRNRGYCSWQCYLAKPPKMAWIEHMYGKPARNVISDLLNQNDSVPVTADLLGIGRQTLYNWINKLGIRRVVRWE